MTCPACHGTGRTTDQDSYTYTPRLINRPCDCQPRHIEQPGPSADDLKYSALARMMEMQNEHA